MSINLVVVGGGRHENISFSLAVLWKNKKTREKKRSFGAFSGLLSNSLKDGGVTAIDVQQVWHTYNNKAQKIRSPPPHTDTSSDSHFLTDKGGEGGWRGVGCTHTCIDRGGKHTHRLTHAPHAPERKHRAETEVQIHMHMRTYLHLQIQSD